MQAEHVWGLCGEALLLQRVGRVQGACWAHSFVAPTAQLSSAMHIQGFPIRGVPWCFPSAMLSRGMRSYLAVFSERLHVGTGQRGAEQCSCMSSGYWLLVACHQDNLMRTCAHTVCPNNSSFPGCSVHVVVATPGRILDLAGKGVAKLQSCKMMAMDEVSLSLGWRSRSCV